MSRFVTNKTLFLFFAIVYSICYIIMIRNWINSTTKPTLNQQVPNVLPHAVPSDEDFAHAADFSSVQRALLRRTWPSLKGYGGRMATSQSSPDDDLLLYKVELSQKTIRTPLFRRKTNGVVSDRHSWKFERILHQTWKTDKIPKETVHWVNKWLKLNPDWTHMFWTDQMALAFIQRHYPSLLNAYKSWTIPVQKSDMFRLLVLYSFGGVYADLDVEPLRPLDQVREWSSCVLSREPDLQTYVMVDDLNVWGNNYTFTCNAFMACRSHHPFIHYLIGRIAANSPFLLAIACHLDGTIHCTGPGFVSLSYGYYLRSVGADIRRVRRETDVYCPEYQYFMPTFDKNRLNQVQTNCGRLNLKEKAREACRAWKERGQTNEPWNCSYTTHHWFHSYHHNVVSESDIRNVAPGILMWNPVDEETDFRITYTGGGN